MNTLAPLLIYLVIAVLVFLLFRQLVLWYWRLNEIADSVVYIAQHFRAIDREEGRIVTDNVRIPLVRTPQEIEAERNLNPFKGS